MGSLLDIIKVTTESATNIGGAIQIVANAFGAVHGVLNGPKKPSDAEVEAAMAQLAAAVKKAQTENTHLQLLALKLQHEFTRMQNMHAELDRYIRYPTPAGGIVRALQLEDGSIDQSHFLCPSCYDDDRRSTLQPSGYSLRCPKCQNLFDFDKLPTHLPRVPFSRA